MVVVFLVAGCSGDNSIKSFSIKKPNLEIEVGKSEVLEVIIEPVEKTLPDVKWKSSDTEIVTVDSVGRIIAHSTGTARVTVQSTDGKHFAECFVIVKEKAVEDILINRSLLELEIGQTEQLTATLLPYEAESEVIWSSDNEQIASVSDSGYVTAISAGMAVITVTSVEGAYSRTCTVTVLPEPPSDQIITVDDLILGGITLQDDANSIVEKLGNPESTTVEAVDNRHDPDYNTYFITWTYHDISFTFWTTQPKSEPEPTFSDRLLLISTESSKYETHRGIKVGDPLSKVYEQYGQEDIDLEENVLCYGDNTGYLFVKLFHENEIVTKIQVGSNLD